MSAQGVVEALAGGASTIRATSSVNAGAFDEVEITVPQVLGIEVSQAVIEFSGVGDTFELSASATVVGDLSTAVAFRSGDRTVVTSALSGDPRRLTARGPGEGTIILTSVADPSVTREIVVRVPAVTALSVTPGRSDLFIDRSETLDLSAAVAVVGAADSGVIWSSSNPAVATVNSSGRVTPRATGEALITAQSSFDPRFSDSARVTVRDSSGYSCAALLTPLVNPLTRAPFEMLVFYQSAVASDPVARLRVSREVEALTMQFGGSLSYRGGDGEYDLFFVPRGLAQLLPEVERIVGVLAASENAIFDLEQVEAMAGPEAWLAAAQPLVPNDLNHRYWWMRNSGAATAYWEALNRMAAARPSSERDVVVAVLDSGFAVDHQDFIGRLLPGWDFVDGNAEVRNCDGGAHGSHVAGIVGAAFNPNRGSSGVAYFDWVQMLPVKVFGTSTDGGNVGGTLQAFVDGVRWSVGLSVRGAPANPHRADVINLSLSFGNPANELHPSTQRALSDAIAQAEARGAVVVAAAGNQSFAGNVAQPARVSTLAVGAVGPTALRAPFSNHGEGLSLTAPGGTWGRSCVDNMVSTGHVVRDGRGVHAYTCSQGTSMASPFVAGAVALLIGLEPDLRGDVDAIRDRLLTAARLNPGPNVAEYGAGVLCLDALLTGTGICGR